MNRLGLLFCAVLAMGGAVAGSVLDEMRFSSQPTDDFDQISPMSSDPFASSVLSDIGALRPMRVTIAPEWPDPFEEVVATISGKTSDPYLRLDESTVSRSGNDIIVDLEWSAHSDIVIVGACSSAGYAVEQTYTTWSGSFTLEPYEVTVSLGSFDVGKYQIYVNSQGALEGEAQASFEVRQEYLTFPRPVDDRSWTSLLPEYNSLGWRFEEVIWFSISDPAVQITPIE